MLSSLINELNNKSLLKVKDLIPNFDKYKLNKDFSELYQGNNTFVQIDFLDKTDINNRYGKNSVCFCTTKEDAEKLKEEVQVYNCELEKAQEEIADVLSNYDKGTYFYFSRIGTDIGICNFLTFERNKEVEKQEELERIKEHEKRMEEDKDYRREVEWFREKDRPFGGAFGSWEEYYSYRM